MLGIAIRTYGTVISFDLINCVFMLYTVIWSV